MGLFTPGTCPRCGERIPAGARYCPRCHFDLAKAKTDPVEKRKLEKLEAQATLAKEEATLEPQSRNIPLTVLTLIFCVMQVGSAFLPYIQTPEASAAIKDVTNDWMILLFFAIMSAIFVIGQFSKMVGLMGILSMFVSLFIINQYAASVKPEVADVAVRGFGQYVMVLASAGIAVCGLLLIRSEKTQNKTSASIDNIHT